MEAPFSQRGRYTSVARAGHVFQCLPATPSREQTCHAGAMTVLVALGPGSTRWAEQLRVALAEIGVDQRVATMHDEVDADEVDFVLMWDLPPARLATHTNLRGVLMGGAGFDHLDLATMPDVPFVRLIDPAMAHDIASYALGWTIYFQRDFDRFATAASERTWMSEPPPRFGRDVTVGVLGLGAIGEVVRDMCAHHGYATLGWSRSDHDRPLLDFFAAADVVVNLVPLSDATRGLVGADELAALDDGVLINVGRGPTVDTDALLDALDGPLRAAVLDVFDTEPLPEDSPLWGRTDVVITPHVAGRSDPRTAAPIVAQSIVGLLAGRSPAALIPRD